VQSSALSVSSVVIHEFDDEDDDDEEDGGCEPTPSVVK